MSFLVGCYLAERRGQVRGGADNPCSWVSLLVDGHLADRCGKVRTGADNPDFRVSLLVGGHLGDTWRTRGQLLDTCFTFGPVWVPV